MDLKCFDITAVFTRPFYSLLGEDNSVGSFLSFKPIPKQCISMIMRGNCAASTALMLTDKQALILYGDNKIPSQFSLRQAEVGYLA